jgi:Tfp pilus tip-associated adhesin PilY1
MNKKFIFYKSARLNVSYIVYAALVVLVGMTVPYPAMAQLHFSKYPPTNQSTQGVRPNIILSVDNSQSMGNVDAISNGASVSRLDALKTALITTFNDPTVAGTPGSEKFRLAYESMWQDTGFGPNRGFPSPNPDWDNSMRLFDAAYQSRFLNWVNSLSPNAATVSGAPSQGMIIYAEQYLKGWWLAPSNPASATAARWSTYTNVPAPDDPWNEIPGTSDPNPLPCRPAYFIFATDNDQPYNLAGSSLFVSALFLQHASDAVPWPQGNQTISVPVNSIALASANGHVQTFQAADAEGLAKNLNTILTTTVASSSSTRAITTATASSSLLNNSTMKYVASYDYDLSKAGEYSATNYWGVVEDGNITGTINGWNGAVQGYAGDDTGGAMALWNATIPVGRAAHVFTADSSGTGGIPFTSAALSGDSSNITPDAVNAVLNNPLGDIVNSQPIYVGPPSSLSTNQAYADFTNAFKNRNGIVYVGANDGMLHGFDAGQGTPNAIGSGNEQLAYVPRGLLGSLPMFADAGYMHRYWVDGSPFSGDAQTATSTYPGHWATVLVGTLGAGGPGYFVLDVSKPGSFTASNVLLDTTDPANSSTVAAAQVMTGGTAAATPGATTTERYIGNQFSPAVMEMYTTSQSAQIVQLNTTDTSGEWGVIMGNGYNSASGMPVLLIQSLTESGMPLYMVPVCNDSASSSCTAAGNGNGLSAPRPVDVDGNGTVDIVYAGDLMGNLWKFDISSPYHYQWQVAYGGQPMFTAVGPANQAQPITSAPVVVPNPNGGFMVVFGTGENLTDADAADTNLNSVYGLYDNQYMTPGTVMVGNTLTSTSVSQVMLGNTTFGSASASLTPFCTANGSTSRYSCLYPQTGGAISSGTTQTTDTGVTVTSNASSNQDVTIDGTTMRGWYYDIPEIANGNAAKVLANPMVMSGNTLVFYSQNVASNTATNGAAASPSGTPESCSAAPLHSAVTTVNYFDLFTGNSAINNTITIGDLTFNVGDSNPQGNRLQIGGVTSFIPNGADSLSALGQNVSINSKSPVLSGPGRRVGWRIVR